MIAIDMVRRPFRDGLKAFQYMNRTSVQARVSLRIPETGAMKGIVARFETLNANPASGKVNGGITNLVQGSSQRR